MSGDWSIDRVSVSFGDSKILDGFSMSLPHTGCVCFSGPSGRGKTTLLHVIAGLVRPDSGEVHWGKGPMPSMAYVFQDDRLLPWMTAAENVETALRGVPREDRRSAAVGLLARLGLADAAGKYPEELSGGMKQRVSIARALAFDARVILLDEPFKGLDPDSKKTVKDIILDLKKDRLILLVTHDRGDADDLADRIVAL